MTNLVAAILITVVTNVTEGRVQIGTKAGAIPPGYENLLVYFSEPVYDPNKKSITTTVKRVTTCKFDWLGKLREVVEEEILSEKTLIMEKVSDWKISAIQPSKPLPDVGPRSGFITNATVFGSLDIYQK